MPQPILAPLAQLVHKLTRSLSSNSMLSTVCYQWSYEYGCNFETRTIVLAFVVNTIFGNTRKA